MANVLLLAKIEAAKKAISDAETEFQEVAEDGPGSSGDEGAEDDEFVRAASAKLTAAKAMLADLRAQLVDLEETMALAKLETARTSVGEAEKHLDDVLADLVIDPGADTTWMGKVTKDAFAKLRLAKATLEDLESIATEED